MKIEDRKLGFNLSLALLHIPLEPRFIIWIMEMTEILKKAFSPLSSFVLGHFLVTEHKLEWIRSQTKDGNFYVMRY